MTPIKLGEMRRGSRDRGADMMSNYSTGKDSAYVTYLINTKPTQDSMRKGSRKVRIKKNAGSREDIRIIDGNTRSEAYDSDL